jgi:hypothetical protein
LVVVRRLWAALARPVLLPMKGRTEVRADEEFEEEDAAFELGMGSASPAGGADVVGDALLELYAAVMKLAVLVAEADEDEFRVIAPRLALLKAAVGCLPTAPAPRKRMGFQPPPPKRARKAKRRR